MGSCLVTERKLDHRASCNCPRPGSHCWEWWTPDSNSDVYGETQRGAQMWSAPEGAVPGEVRSRQDLEGCGVELKAKPEAPGR